MAETTASTRIVHVAVGVIRNNIGEILVSRRSAAQHMGGFWEFPGGKVEPGESVRQALSRELLEELNITVSAESLQPLCCIRHDYPDKSVLLDVWQTDRYNGAPLGMEGQPLRWVAADKLVADEFPPGNRGIIRALRLPRRLMLINCDEQLTRNLPVTSKLPDRSLIRLRFMGQEQSFGEYLHTLNVLVPDITHDILVDLPTARVEQQALVELRESHRQIKGFFANRHVAQSMTSRPDGDDLIFGCATHNAAEVSTARQLGADFVIISPVLPSRSHPQDPGLGWKQFSELAGLFPGPAFAMGGMTHQDLESAMAAGAHGIAGISMFNVSTSV
ncbi:Nudix family hydrolase [Pseudohongiella spirulinae]|uniref:8-oxo-dGTP diphosphatase n=1 Tax=Pseudohongiella spirulinae TaxID=1249552 RepID=A0A0S2KF30_9GAMM|nr:Nudix family hydrolase [Pseudohongiella spirulinae]ALO46920.1 Mutator MutT protein [Pseudohongiella spirulinae]